MQELKIKIEGPMFLEQFQCPGCEKKFYINKDDVDELTDELDCPFCDIKGMNNIRLFEVEIKKIFEKD